MAVAARDRHGTTGDETMDPVTATALTMIAAALVSTPPLFAWCVRDVGRRETARAGQR